MFATPLRLHPQRRAVPIVYPLPLPGVPKDTIGHLIGAFYFPEQIFHLVSPRVGHRAGAGDAYFQSRPRPYRFEAASPRRP